MCNLHENWWFFTVLQTKKYNPFLIVVSKRHWVIIRQMTFNFCHNLTVILNVLTIFYINSIFAKVLPDGWTQFFWGNSNFAEENEIFVHFNFSLLFIWHYLTLLSNYEPQIKGISGKVTIFFNNFLSKVELVLLSNWCLNSQ